MSDESTLEPDEETAGAASVVIPWQRLSASALQGVLEEFVTREGTDYGHSEVTLEEKVRQVQRQLERGEVFVLFEGESKSVNIATAKELRTLGIAFEVP